MVINTREYVSVLRELVEEGRKVGIQISGDSMSPFLRHERDYICFEKPRRELKRGDMVFYQRRNGQFVMHRIFKVKPNGYYLVGDAQNEIEGPIERDQIFAIVTKVSRKGKWMEAGDFWWDFFAKVWIRMVPCRYGIRRLYSAVFRAGSSDER